MLESFASGEPMRVGDVARAAGIGQSTASRLLATRRRAAWSNAMRKTTLYFLGLELLTLAGIAINQNRVHRVGRQIAQGWPASSGSASTALLRGAELIYLCNFEGPLSPKSHTLMGQRVPLHATSIGKSTLVGTSRDSRHTLLPELVGYTAPRTRPWTGKSLSSPAADTRPRSRSSCSAGRRWRRRSSTGPGGSSRRSRSRGHARPSISRPARRSSAGSSSRPLTASAPDSGTRDLPAESPATPVSPTRRSLNECPPNPPRRARGPARPRSPMPWPRERLARFATPRRLPEAPARAGGGADPLRRARRARPATTTPGPRGVARPRRAAPRPRDHAPVAPRSGRVPRRPRRSGRRGCRRAALREAREETGLDPAGVEVLGTLDVIPMSTHLVTPVLGWWRHPSPVGVVDEAESAAVFRAPVADLLDPANRGSTVIRRAGQEWRGPGFLVPAYDRRAPGVGLHRDAARRPVRPPRVDRALGRDRRAPARTAEAGASAD